MKEPVYIKIHCETQRERDMRWRWRPAHSDQEPKPGTCYAQKVDGRWRCCCCGKSVRVAW